MASLRFRFTTAALITLVSFLVSFQLLYLETQDVPKKFPTILDASRVKSTDKLSPVSESIYQVQNETLGFEKIYMISLPDRTDKQDAFAMQAAFSEISYILVDGVHGDEVPAKTLPHTLNQKAGIAESWRAHNNIHRKMVHENVSTALIFEDDADWDVALKHQLVQFARGSRFVGGTAEWDVPNSPYGDDWDLLWIGHCCTWVLPDDSRRFFVIPNDPTVDPTVQPPRVRQDNEAKPDMSHWQTRPDNGERTRIVFRSAGAVCTAAYAISQQGARKAFYNLSMIPSNAPVDRVIAELCKNKEYNFKCISPWPQLVGLSRPTSNTAKWSDMDDASDAKYTAEEGRTPHLMYSVRQNVPDWLNGTNIFRSSYPDIAPPMGINDIGKATGYAEILTSRNVPKGQ